MSKANDLAKKAKESRNKKLITNQKEFDRIKSDMITFLETQANDGKGFVTIDSKEHEEFYMALLQDEMKAFLTSSENNFSLTPSIHGLQISWQEDPAPKAIPEPVEIPKPVVAPKPEPKPVPTPKPEPKPEPKPKP